MRRMLLLLSGICSLTLAAGCCCWGHNKCCDPCGTGGCGPGGCGVQQYGQPYQSGAYYAPTGPQQAFAPAPVIGAPIESVPTYY